MEQKKKIICDYQLVDCRPHGKIFSCFVDSQVISNHSEIIFCDIKKSGKSSQDVVGIAFENCDISKMPQGLMKIFPNLKVISITKSNLKSINRDDLREYSDIIDIGFPDNQIEYLPGDLFTDMRNLKAISFSRNKIRCIEPNILNGLDKLVFVSFSENACFNIRFDLICNVGNATLQEVKNELVAKFSSSLAKCQHGMLNDLKKIIQNEKLRDFTVKVGDEEFKVHKLLLAARSPVLAEMIENNIDDEELNLITDISIDIFRETLKFIYTDELSKSDEINFIQLFAAAGRLKIESLENFAAEKVIDKINAENALEILILANKYENDNLRRKAFDIFKTDLKEVEITDEMAKQPEKLMKLLEIKKKRKKEMVKEMEEIAEEFKKFKD